MLPVALHLVAVSWAAPEEPPSTGTAPAPASAEERKKPASAATSGLSMFVFEGGVPVAGLELQVGGESRGQTDETGGIEVDIPSGRLPVALVRDGVPIVELDLLTDKNEIVQVIVTLEEGAEPALDIESSSESLPLASERSESARSSGEDQPDLPPGAMVGKIISAEDGKPVVNARVFFTGTSVETRTDRDGAFAAELAPGTYAISVVHPDYATQTLDNMRVISEKEVTANIELTPAGIQLQDYVVTAPYVEGNVASTIAAQRETSSVVEVLGAEQMAAAGDGDAAEALQRVSGLTVEQGKFVLVRGQPFRYTATLWNGSPLPSPEPLVRVVPLDLFPTGVLSGIEVQKSYSADLPASFGAGLINLRTRGVPDEAFLTLGISSGLNSVSSFSNGLDYDGGAFDFFGYDDGTRALPDDVVAINAASGDLTGLDDEEQAAVAKQFSNVYDADERTLPPDFGLSLSGAGSVNLPGDGKLGAVGALNLGTSWRRQERFQGSYALNGGELVRQNSFTERRTDYNADVGGILTVQAQWDRHDLSANTFYAHQTQQRTEVITGPQNRSDDGIVRETALSWIERQILAQQLSGRNDFGAVKLDYRGMIASAGRDAPDRRSYAYIDREENGEFGVFGDSGAVREFSGVSDAVRSYAIDGTFVLSDPDERWFGFQLKTGVAGTSQDRDAFTRSYNWSPEEDRGADIIETNPEVLYDPANTGDDGTLDFRDGSNGIRDDYIGSLRVFGVYGLADARLGDIVRLVGGLRYERAEVSVTTFQLEPNDENAVEGGFDHREACFSGAECAMYPSASATVFLGESMQLRAAYGRSTSRPNLNELSDARFIDPDTGEFFLGRPELRPAMINGADVRWEWYPSTTESITIGGFWKQYTDPIERSYLQVGGSDPVPAYQNADEARVLGLELGGRLEFGPIYTVANLALLNSRVTLEESGVNTDSVRPLDGQATYTLNVQAGYSGEAHDVTVSLNVVGRRLHRAGAFTQPNVFLEPIEGLNAAWTWQVFETDHYTGGLRVTASNLINPRWDWTQGGELWRDYRRGFQGSLSLNVGIK